MRHKASSSLVLAAFLAIAGAIVPRTAAAATYQAIYTLPEASTGRLLSSPLAAAANGDLYGTSQLGGTSGEGYVFRLVPPASGATAWTGNLVYGFGANAPDGLYEPWGLAIAGNALLGVTSNGGTFGDGAAYRLAPGAGLTVLHAFAGSVAGGGPGDGAGPGAAPALGLFGLYYGTTEIGGQGRGYGTVYALSGSASNPSYSVVHRFSATGGDAAGPTAGTLAIDGAGRLFGVTGGGGTLGKGALYMLSYLNGWHEQVIYSFDSWLVNANAVIDAAGNVYVCGDLGASSTGSVLEFTPPAQPGGSWTKTDLYDFARIPEGDADCLTDACGLAIDPVSGKLFGTSEFGGASGGGGAIFEVDPPATGQTGWTEQVLHSFSNRGDENYPFAAPVLVGGVLYGTAGTTKIWSVTP